MKEMLSNGNMRKVIYNKWALVMFLVVFGLVLRLLPHPANFVPIGAIALFSGLYLPKRFALVVPLVVAIISILSLFLYHAKSKYGDTHIALS